MSSAEILAIIPTVRACWSMQSELCGEACDRWRQRYDNPGSLHRLGKPVVIGPSRLFRSLEHLISWPANPTSRLADLGRNRCGGGW
jgi:hypothetical protein